MAGLLIQLLKQVVVVLLLLVVVEVVISMYMSISVPCKILSHITIDIQHLYNIQEIIACPCHLFYIILDA